MTQKYPYKKFEEHKGIDKKLILVNLKDYIKNNLCVEDEIFNSVVVDVARNFEVQSTNVKDYSWKYENVLLDEYTLKLNCVRYWIAVERFGNALRKLKRLEVIKKEVIKDIKLLDEDKNEREEFKPLLKEELDYEEFCINNEIIELEIKVEQENKRIDHYRNILRYGV